jgi:hypothetical protein
MRGLIRATHRTGSIRRRPGSGKVTSLVAVARSRGLFATEGLQTLDKPTEFVIHPECYITFSLFFLLGYCIYLPMVVATDVWQAAERAVSLI